MIQQQSQVKMSLALDVLIFKPINLQDFIEFFPNFLELSFNFTKNSLRNVFGGFLVQILLDF